MQKFTIDQLYELADDKCLPVAACIMAYQRRSTYNEELQKAFTLRKILERSIILLFYNQHRVQFDTRFTHTIKDSVTTVEEIRTMAGLAHNKDALYFLDQHPDQPLDEDFMISLLMAALGNFGEAATQHNKECGIRML